MTVGRDADVRAVGRRRLVGADRRRCARGVLYVTTGDNYSHPGDGDERRRRGARISNPAVSCGRSRRRRATSTTRRAAPPARIVRRGRGPDHDYGSSAMLVRHADGRDVLVAGQKSGMVYALDPANSGARAVAGSRRQRRDQRRRAVGHGERRPSSSMRPCPTWSGLQNVSGAGTHWQRAHLTASHGGGLTALDVADGDRVWFAPGVPCAPPRSGMQPGAACAP